MSDNLPTTRQTTLAVTGFSVEALAEADAEACIDYLRFAAPQMANGRDALGLVLWRLAATASEAVYRSEAKKLADVLDVSTDTLTRWRRRSEEAHGLAAPTVRTAIRRARPDHAPGASVAKAAQVPTSAQQVADARLDAPTPPAPRPAAVPKPGEPCPTCGRRVPVPMTTTKSIYTDPKDCKHPANLRLGTGCAACGATVKR